MITYDREVSFETVLYHCETDEPLEVRVHAWIEGMDTTVGLMEEHLSDIDVTGPDQEEIDLDLYGGVEAIRDSAFEADNQQTIDGETP